MYPLEWPRWTFPMPANFAKYQLPNAVDQTSRKIWRLTYFVYHHMSNQTQYWIKYKRIQLYLYHYSGLLRNACKLNSVLCNRSSKMNAIILVFSYSRYIKPARSSLVTESLLPSRNESLKRQCLMIGDGCINRNSIVFFINNVISLGKHKATNVEFVTKL